MTLRAELESSIAMSVNDKEMTATFKIANTTAGTDAVDRSHGRLTRWILN
jgi:hypothetical protein